MTIRGIEINELLVESKTARIYLATKDGKTVILKIAKTFGDNRDMDIESNVFNFFDNAVKYCRERNIEERRSSPSRFDLLYAKLEDSFIEDSQYDRRINILSARDIEIDELCRLTEMHKKFEIDLRTSAWIMGRLLKWGIFHEYLHIVSEAEEKEREKEAQKKKEYYDKDPFQNYYEFYPDDWLICPEKHRLVYYNGTNKNYTTSEYTNVVQDMAKFVLDWIGIDKPNEKEQEYIKTLKSLQKDGKLRYGFTPQGISEVFYDAVKKVWDIIYYPFTYRERGTKQWQTKEETTEQL